MPAHPLTVRRLLEYQGRSVSWAARRLGIPRATLSHYLTGARPTPPHTQRRLCELLGVPDDAVAQVTASAPRSHA